MRHSGKTDRAAAPRSARPGMEWLETRQVLAGIPSTSVFVTQAYSQLMGDLKKMELNSRATPAEFLALRDDTRAISAATAASTLTASVAQSKANLVSTIIDRSTVDGGLNASGWADVVSRLEAGLNGLAVGQPLIDQTVADMKAVATSARVTPGEYQQFNKDFTSLSTAESIPGSIDYENTNPSLYFAQHLGGFFRNWAVQRTTDVAKLKSDQRLIPSEAGASPAEAAVVGRDVNILENLGAKVPSDDDTSFLNNYATVASQPASGDHDITQLSVPLVSALDVKTTPAQEAEIKELLADAPEFYQAMGSSTTNVQTIIQDVQAVVNDGVSSAPNPFKITIE